MVATRPQVVAKIRGAMRQRNYGQTEIAERLGISQSALSRKLNGEVTFKAEEIAKLSLILEKPEFMQIAKELGYTAARPLEEEVDKEEVLLASKAFQEVITRLPVSDRRMAYYLTAIVLGGLSPTEAAKESRFLRSLSRVETSD